MLPLSDTPRMPNAGRPSMGPPPPPAVDMQPGTALTPSSRISSFQAPRAGSGEGAESLKLPPLQKHMEPGASIESLIMNMNFLGKIRILRKTAPPLKNTINAPGFDNRRGSILAVEGDKGVMMDAVMVALEEALRRLGEFDIKVVHGPMLPDSHANYKSFLEAVSDWHSKISGIVDFLKGSDHEGRQGSLWSDQPIHRQTPRASATSLNSARSVVENDSRMDIDNADSVPDKTSLRRSERRDSSISRISDTSKHSDSSQFYSSEDPSLPKIPLLIIPQYLLHASDMWAAALPVTGEYGVPDHWQWTATLWRGIPGPDFVLYVKNDTDNGGNHMPTPQGDGSWPGHRPSETWTKGPVELKEDIGVLLVKQEKGSSVTSAMRRVAFELSEWARVVAGRPK
jgi:hypothetical protein